MKVIINLLTLISIVIEPLEFKLIKFDDSTNENNSNFSISNNSSFTEKCNETNKQGFGHNNKLHETNHAFKNTAKTKNTVKPVKFSKNQKPPNCTVLVKESENNIKSEMKVNVKDKHIMLKRKTNIPLKQKKPKKKGKVFLDSKEETLHYKLIDNMLFKPLESNNSVSIDVSEDDEITEDNIRQAIEGREGSFIAIPLKRKKDAYKEFLRWAHSHEKNERRVKIEKEIFDKYKIKLSTTSPSFGTSRNNTYPTSIPVNLQNIDPQIINTTTQDKKGLVTPHIKPISTEYRNKKHEQNNLFINISTSNAVNTTKTKHKHFQRTTPKHKFQTNPNTLKKQKYFKEETVEFQFDPNFADKLYNTVQKEKKKPKKKKKNKVKTYNSEFDIKEDISADDYSAQEKFMLNNQKEAMGRRFYQMFENKTASDFWDNTTLETTKMLEILIPLGEHLHKVLDKLPPNEAKHFMTNLQMYKTELEKFIVLVKQDKAETRNDVVALISEPYEHVCETKYSDEEVKIMFGWTDQEYEHFEKVLEETREMWFDLQMFHHCYQFVSESTESESSSMYNCSNIHPQNSTGFFS